MIWNSSLIIILITSLLRRGIEFDGNYLEIRSNNHGFDGYGKIYNYTLQNELNFFNYDFHTINLFEIKERKNYNDNMCMNTTVNMNVSFYYAPIFELLYVNDNCSYQEDLYYCLICSSLSLVIIQYCIS